ncbi:MAG: mannonate dehydratase [Spirochaetes bacterium GWD1_61_31]|nr:MAG: mannonate dehydratase [Spirochaetes bacterium GWB1_60_80]OHD28667.1 MAG: mannonate dehydratase [Spirochaetes bacterium GWC1_61_12]OHD34950.1 MAG: mannonate dehydratase [Spirochaetes bacterium GWD1_61_31]OHD43309.1 MAG: mannonate dehydratase [Spirochaetes bacterium GWE1_60_18]OHD58847.1 MAG: mannonate dehydratase [Spirochaetes bacterium GWF1_60_12]HAP42501.1 mannonate dehydratase [Spirochaetaceae bacterium]
MYMSFRWFGPQDAVPLRHIRQIPLLRSVVSALYDLAPGQVWPLERLQTLRAQAEAASLAWRVVESIPVPESVKLGAPGRERDIGTWLDSLRAVAAALGPASPQQDGADWAGRSSPVVVTYNFMPVFDWTRSHLAQPLPDGSTCLAYDAAAVARLDPLAGDRQLPGWLTNYAPAELAGLLEAYRGIGQEAVFANLVYFLKAVCPEAERLGLRLALHPDDPPWPVFGLPRVVTGAKALRDLFKAVPSSANGLCLCSGSLGASPDNDIVGLIREFSDRLAFMHLRNVKLTGPRSFEESAHPSSCGSLDMAAIVAALVDSGFDGPARPDHGRMIWDETGKPGYGLYDRALGASYLTGLIEQAERQRRLSQLSPAG